MRLILAIESDRKQAARIAAIARDRLKVEIVVAETAGDALKALSNRTPELILTPQLMASKDEEMLDARLRELDAAGSRVQTLMIPVLSSSKGKGGRKKGLLNRLRGGNGHAALEDGCDPSVFAAQIEEYLDRAADDRARAARLKAEQEEDDASAAAPQPLAVAAPVPMNADEWPAQFDEQLPPIESSHTLAPAPDETVAQASHVFTEEAHAATPGTITLDDIDRIPELSPLGEAPDSTSSSNAEHYAVEHFEIERHETVQSPDTRAHLANQEDARGLNVEGFLDAINESEARAAAASELKTSDPWEELDLDELPATPPVIEPRFEEPPAVTRSGKRAKVTESSAKTKANPIAPQVAIAQQAQKAAAQAEITGRDLFTEFVTFDELCVVDLPTALLGDLAEPLEQATAAASEVTPLNLDAIQEIDEGDPEPQPEPVAIARPKKTQARQEEAAAAVEPPAARPAKKRVATDPSKPKEDEWGFFDPIQCGFAALLAKLDDPDEEEEKKKQKALR